MISLLGDHGCSFFGYEMIGNGLERGVEFVDELCRLVLQQVSIGHWPLSPDAECMVPTLYHNQQQ